MKFDAHTHLEELRADATKLADALAAELAKHRQKMSELSSEDVKKRYSPQYWTFQVQNERSRARQIGKTEEPVFRELKTKLEAAAQAWSTETLMRRARAVPETGRTESDILNELRLMRAEREFAVATPSELIEFANEARESGDLASLRLIKKEVNRRQFDGLDRARVRVALDEAIAGVQVPGQAEAHSILQAALEKVADAWDSLSELQTGREPLRAEVQRITAKHFPRTGDGEHEGDVQEIGAGTA